MAASVAESTSEDFLVKTNQPIEPMTNKSEQSSSENKASEDAARFKKSLKPKSPKSLRAGLIYAISFSPSKTTSTSPINTQPTKGLTSIKLIKRSKKTGAPHKPCSFPSL